MKRGFVKEAAAADYNRPRKRLLVEPRRFGRLFDGSPEGSGQAGMSYGEPGSAYPGLGGLSYQKRYKLSCISADKLEKLDWAKITTGLSDQCFDQYLSSLFNFKQPAKEITGTERACVYNCIVDAFGNCNFQMPVFEEGRTPLQRAFGDDKVLQVTFCKQNKSSEKTFREILKTGLHVGLRYFEYFVYKEEKKSKNAKKVKKQSPTCYFLCTKSFAISDFTDPYFTKFQSLERCCSFLMHIHTVATVPLYIKRLQLALSRTTKAKIDMTRLNINRIEDTPCLKSGEVVRDSSGKILIHTDGTGFISVDLAKKCAELSDNAISYPALFQVRLFYQGMAIKGTLLTLKTLPDQTICYRDSMLKVSNDPCLSMLECYNSLEICNMSHKPSTASLSRYIIGLLTICRVPESIFLDAVDDAIAQAEVPLRDMGHAIAVCYQFAESGDLARRMLLSGIPLTDPFLQQTLTGLVRSRLMNYSKCKVPLEGCYYLMGTADPTGSLKRNQVAILLETGPVYRDKVLVYKHPGMHYGDIHVFEATWNQDLEREIGHGQYAIMFSTQGERSIVDEIANSDLDGDMYWICTNEKVIMHFKRMDPWRNPGGKALVLPRPSDLSSDVLKNLLIDMFIKATFQPSMAIAIAATNWLVHMDTYLSLGPDETGERRRRQDCLGDLVDLYYEALDSEKTGTKVEVAEALIENRRPHFLPDQNYRSKSIFGMIYDRVMEAGEKEKQQSVGQPVWYSEFEYGNFTQYKVFWKVKFDSYRLEMQLACKADAAIRDSRATDIYKKYQQLLFGSPCWETATKHPYQIFEEACAIYSAVFDYNYQMGKSNFNFAWKVAGDPLLDLFCSRQPGRKYLIAESRIHFLQPCRTKSKKNHNVTSAFIQELDD